MSNLVLNYNLRGGEHVGKGCLTISPRSKPSHIQLSFLIVMIKLKIPSKFGFRTNLSYMNPIKILLRGYKIPQVQYIIVD